MLRSLLEERERALHYCESRGPEVIEPVCSASEGDELFSHPDIAAFRTSLSCFVAGMSLVVLRVVFGLVRRCLSRARRVDRDEREALERSEIVGPRRSVLRGRGVVS